MKEEWLGNQSKQIFLHANPKHTQGSMGLHDDSGISDPMI